MAIIRLTKTFTFEMAHALFNYDGKCKNIHGHSYKLEVTVIGKPIADDGHASDGLVIDFGDLKKIVNTEVVDIFDHALVMKKDYSENLIKLLDDNFERMLYVDYQPTCENLIEDFAGKIKNSLPEEITLHHLVLHETTTAYCEWYAEDQNG
ncbi:MAG: 6-carboxytetrahydropterin synthase QueD [Bacteroidetes bacterium]|nr:MAG: 6-carboxytetrahydropterin synthase QueD [Bacteroidota bacterium]